MRAAGIGFALVLAMTACNFGDILLTTHTSFMKMKMGLSIRVRAGPAAKRLPPAGGLTMLQSLLPRENQSLHQCSADSMSTVVLHAALSG